MQCEYYVTLSRVRILRPGLVSDGRTIGSTEVTICAVLSCKYYVPAAFNTQKIFLVPISVRG
jgi:hypothetical protein